MGLSGGQAVGLVRRFLNEGIEDKWRRDSAVQIRLGDALKSAYAMFALKFPSLLQFEKARKEASREKTNLEKIFELEQIPSDTQMREILDPVDPSELRPIYKQLHQLLQRNKHLEAFEFHRDFEGDPTYLMPLDGTGFFSSHEVHCENCLIKKSRGGEVTYYHQMLTGCIVHPDLKTVIPFAPEPILKQDGSTKNDCEWNATKRFLEKLKKDHPRLKAVITTDGLITKPAMVKYLNKLNYSYILGVKPGDHKGLFEFINGSDERGHVKHFEWQEVIGDKVKKTIIHHVRVKENIPLSNKDADLAGIHFVEYWQTTEWVSKKKGHQVKKLHFSWVTDLPIKGIKQVQKIVQGGRARWKIENETFNTLKNQGYEFEHNFGHGNKNLSSVFAMLMMLAFFVDQIQQMGCKTFKKILSRLSKTELWQRIRSAYQFFELQSWDHLLEVIRHLLFEKKAPAPVPVPPD